MSTPLKRWLAAFLAAVLAILATPSFADETITYIHWDALGSPVAATDEAGNVVWRESYRPYGERINNEAAASSNSRWYTGHPQDADTGLVYAGARYYDPVVGRFLARDPVAFQENNLHSFNRYAYGNNNPYAYIDLDGREALPLQGDLPSNPAPGWGTAITAGLIASPLAVGAYFSATAAIVTTEVALGEVGFSGGVAATGAAAASGLSRVAKGTRNLPFKDTNRLTEINKTLDRIESGGPFSHKRDGTIFRNKEGKLPKGNYRDYTVDTPGASNRGTRRVVQGTDSRRTYYTNDHYQNFIQIDPLKR